MIDESALILAVSSLVMAALLLATVAARESAVCTIAASASALACCSEVILAEFVPTLAVNKLIEVVNAESASALAVDSDKILALLSSISATSSVLSFAVACLNSLTCADMPDCAKAKSVRISS